jgi:CPA2 family monovalent cation:H+ antiporter-2
MADATHAFDALGPVLLLLGLGIAAMLAAREARVSPIVGYLAVGAVIGPGGLALIRDDATARLLAELGVVFLLFDIGLHFSLRHVWESRGDILGLGPAQVALSAAGLGTAAYLLGVPPLFAAVVGLTLALSSTAVVARLIAERHQQNCPVGLTATAILIFQDLVAIFLLILATSLGRGEGGFPLAAALGLALAKAAGAFVAAVLIGRHAARPLFALLARTRNEEVFTASALFMALLAAAATGAMGLSLTLGAFLGGTIIAETAYRPVVQSEIKPFRGLLLGFFFISVGMGLDPRLLASGWPLVLALAGGLIVAKILLVGAAGRLFGWTLPGSVQLGFLLAQGSEFAFVILSLGPVREGLGDHAVGALIAAVAASLAATPTLAEAGRALAGRLRQRLARVDPAETTPRGRAAPVLIVGMGEVGRTVADGLTAFGVGYAALERDPERYARANADGYAVAFGDAAEPRLWEPMALGERRATVVTPARYEVSAPLSPISRERYPDLVRFVPVPNEAERRRFDAVGMRAVLDRGVPRGLDLAGAVLECLGLEPGAVADWQRRARERASTPATAQRVA